MRPANREDIPGIAVVHVESWKETYRGIVVDQVLDQLSVEQKMKQWKQIFDRDSQDEDSTLGKTFVAVNERGEVVAFAHFCSERTGKYEMDGELTAIYMLKDYHRNGLGGRLLRAGVEHLLENNLKSMLVWALSENEFKCFYEKYGPLEIDRQFLQIGERSHEEIAYGWKDLSLLLQALTKTSS